MDDANQLRLIAAGIIHKLWKAGEKTQLELLEAQAKRSVEEIKKHKASKRKAST